MLRAPRSVRAAFARDVLASSLPLEVAREIWMLRQPEAVRESYISEVLGG